MRQSSRKTILVIEDNPDILSAMLELLQLEQYECVGSPNGRHGLELAVKIKPDLIIADILMPVLDGEGFLREKALSSTIAAIPVIILTASRLAKPKPEFTKDVREILHKPVELNQLLTAVSSALE